MHDRIILLNCCMKFVYYQNLSLIIRRGSLICYHFKIEKVLLLRANKTKDIIVKSNLNDILSLNFDKKYLFTN